MSIGTVKPRGGGREIACRILHLSPFGARLALLEPAVVQGEFTLATGVGGAVREARVVGRDGLTVMAELRPLAAVAAGAARPAA